MRPGARYQRRLNVDGKGHPGITLHGLPQIEMHGPAGIDFRKNHLVQADNPRGGGRFLSFLQDESASSALRGDTNCPRRVIRRLRVLILLMLSVTSIVERDFERGFTRADRSTIRPPTAQQATDDGPTGVCQLKGECLT
jgi:hypothetical protein